MTSSTVDERARSDVDASDVAQEWLGQFVAMINARDASRVAELFVPGGGWRDLVSLTWDLQSAVGLDAVTGFVASTITSAQIVDFKLTGAVPAALDETGGAPVLTASFAWDTTTTQSRGLVRLVPNGASGWSAFTVLTELYALSGVADSASTTWDDMSNPRWTEAIEGNQNWVDSRDSARPFPTATPTVLLVGAGQASLQVAAHLRRLGVDYIAVERNPRLGDSWRKRHYNLITHTPSFADHFSYLPFPKSWPISMQKDKLANWIEGYAEALDLDVWTEHECVSARFLAEERRWEVEVRRPSGEVEVMRPKHLVVATGLLGPPRYPNLPHRDAFAGTVFHSTDYVSGGDWLGKKTVVVGSGSTAHDIAQDLYEKGCRDITMIQRSPTYIISFKGGIKLAYDSTYGPTGETDLDVADLTYKATPMPMLVEMTDAFTEQVGKEIDAQLIERLNAKGFRTNADGLLRLSLTPYISGYYIDQGASKLIVDGKVLVKSGEVSDLDESGVVFTDGGHLDADLIVLCTGYFNARESLRCLISDEAADAVADAWVLDYERRGGEHGLLWGESGQPNLWFAAGGIHQCRLYSGALALKLAALERGLVTSVGKPA